MTNTDGLSLYHYRGCMFCAMVQRALQQLGVEIAERDIHREPEHLRALVDATGRQTVPCLRIEEAGEDRWMHESSEIIAYLQERFAPAS